MRTRQFAEDSVPRSRVLDAGCGTGGLLAKIAAVWLSMFVDFSVMPLRLSTLT